MWISYKAKVIHTNYLRQTIWKVKSEYCVRLNASVEVKKQLSNGPLNQYHNKSEFSTKIDFFLNLLEGHAESN